MGRGPQCIKLRAILLLRMYGVVCLFLGGGKAGSQEKCEIGLSKLLGLTGLDPEVNRFLLNDGPGPREVGIADIVRVIV